MNISKLNAFVLVLLLASTGTGIYLIKTYLFNPSFNSGSASGGGNSTSIPSSRPSESPILSVVTRSPSFRPTLDTTVGPTLTPTEIPTLRSESSTSIMPTVYQSSEPTPSPTLNPTQSPQVSNSVTPTAYPSFTPVSSSTLIPTINPTALPTFTATVIPTAYPSSNPTLSPTLKLSVDPTVTPTITPTAIPSSNPTLSPTLKPSVDPTVTPTIIPTAIPSSNPTTASGIYTTTTVIGTNFIQQSSTASVTFYQPADIAHDSNGNQYITDSYNYIIRKITPTGTVSVLAGAVLAPGAIDGVGTSANFFSPSGIAPDTSGNVFVVDSGNNAIRMIDPTGQVTTPFGALTISGAVDGIGTSARFNTPSGITFDSSGNMFIGDSGNHAIRKIASGSTSVTTFAGFLGTSGSTDGTGTDAKFKNPAGVAADSSGNVFVADKANNKIRKVTPLGVVSTLVTLTSYTPLDVACDTSENVYVSAGAIHSILRVTSAGIPSQIAGSSLGSSGYADGSGTNVRFNTPAGLDLDTSGNLFIADSGNDLIRKIASSTGVVSSYAGIYRSVVYADGASASVVYLSADGITCDTSGNIFLLANNAIWKISLVGLVSILAGKQYTSGSTDGTGTDARFTNLKGVSVDPTTGNIVAADASLNTIRKVSPNGVVTTFSGSSYGHANGAGTSAQFRTPYDVAVDSSGTSYVADSGNNVIRKISSGGVVTDFAGTVNGVDNSDGVGTSAGFGALVAITVDSLGNIYASDSQNFYSIRKVTPSGSVSTIAGGTISGYMDGVGTHAQFLNPYGIAVDTDGNVYVADQDGYCIRKISPSLTVTTIAGTPTLSSSLDSTGTNSLFVTPTKVAVDTNGNIYVTDFGTKLVRKLYD